jgi:hypothetical protein
MGGDFKRVMQLIIALSLVAPYIKAQTLPNDTSALNIKNSLLNYYKTYPREKIFIHTNAQVYYSGQTIWYKVYALAFGKASAISKILYVQLFDTTGHIIVQNKLPLNEGIAHGNIDLPAKLPTGWYQLRSFTAWMMNFPTEDFFNSRIYIKNTADSAAVAQPVEKASKYLIKFYPEGGDPVEGNASVIAFKATGTNYSPAKVYGKVIDEAGQKVADILGVHDGMGEFEMEGFAGHIYKAIVHFPDSSIQKVNLPMFKAEGVEMKVNNAAPDHITMKLTYSGSKEKYSHINLVAFQNTGTIITYPLKLGRGINVFNINKNLFTTGMVRLSIFDGSNVPLAERMVFVNNHDMANIKLVADTLSFDAKGKNTIAIQAKNGGGDPIKGNFSVSVRDYKTTDEEDAFADNICSSFLVSSELRGSLYHPGYYFQSGADSLQDQLDLVMLTNGWRHFSWDTLLNASPKKLKYVPERSQYIAGQIISKDKIIGEKIKLIIINQDSSKYIGYITPDSLGRFILRNYEHRGVSQLFVETVDSKNHIKKVVTKLLNNFPDSLKNQMPEHFSEKYIPQSIFSNLGTDNVFNATDGRMLQTIVVKGKKLSPTDEVINKHVSPLYHSIQEYTLDLVTNPAPDISLIDYLKGRFPGLQVYTDGDTVRFVYRSTSTIMAQPEPYIYLNENQTIFANVRDINLHNVALIRFMPPPVGFAPYNGGNVGALMIYTKKGTDELATIESDEKFDKYTFNGYTITREFASPDYSIAANKNVADIRTTLYWQPELKTDATGHASFNFYNSDHTNGYVIIIQVMDSEGHTGCLYKIIHKQ